MARKVSRPRRRTARRRTPRRGGKTRRPTTAPIRHMSWNGQPFPREMNTTFTHASSVVISAPLGAIGTQLYSSNSLVDPDVTGVGGQPRFFDTLVGANATDAPYNSYRVYASKITVEAITTTDSISARGFLGLGFFSSAGTPASTIQEMRERRDYKTKFMGIYTGGRELVRMSSKKANKYIFGIKDMKDDEETAAAYNANPVKAGRWAISYGTFDAGSTATIRCLVKITYFCTLFTMNDVRDS